MSCRCALIGIEACVVLWTRLAGLRIHTGCREMLIACGGLVVVGINWKQVNIISADH